MTPPNQILLRSDLGNNIESKTNRNNLLAISPDVIPLFSADITDPEELVDTYSDFVSLPLERKEINNLYVRGYVTDAKRVAKTNVTLSAVNNELILWPQAINSAKKLGSITLSYDPANTKDTEGQVTASVKRIKYTPLDMGGRHPVLLAKTDASPALAKFPIVKNWKDLFKTVGADDSFCAYNVAIIDPVFEVYSLSSRLRFFDDSKSTVRLEIDVESIGIPEGYEFSLYSEDDKFRISRRALVAGVAINTTVEVKDGYDVPISIQIYNVKGKLIPENASVSIIAHVVEGPGKLKKSYILGGEHIVFTPNARLLKDLPTKVPPVQLLTSQTMRAAAAATTAENSTAPAFWFRGELNDTDKFPRPDSSSVWHSPDIQVSGKDRYSNPQQTLGGTNYMADQSSVNVVASGQANYLYLRGKCSSAVNMQTRVFVVPNNILLHPKLYSQYPVYDVDDHNNKSTAIRVLKSTGAGVLVLDDPFNVFDPRAPSAVDTNSDHYCLIAEARINDDDLDEDWPTEDLPTSVDLGKWLHNSPHMCQRNIGWDNLTKEDQFVFQTGLYIPDSFTSTDSFELDLYWKNVPVGGYVSCSTTGSQDFGINEVEITQQNLGVHTTTHTGLSTPYTATVTVTWRKGSGGNLPVDSEIGVQLRQVASPAQKLIRSSAKSAAVGLSSRVPVFERIPTQISVGSAYPHLKEGGVIKTSRHEHLVANGKLALMADAFPTPRLPSAGVHGNSKASRKGKIPRVMVLGGDQIVVRK